MDPVRGPASNGVDADKFRQEQAIETIPMIETGNLALDSDDLIETLNDLGNLLGLGATEFRPDAFDGKCANLADLDPRAFRQLCRLKLESQREAGALRPACQRQCDDGAGTFIKHVVAENQHRTQARLFATADRVEVGPPNLAPQYSGQASSSCPKPSSASAFSNLGSSFAHSDAKRPRSIRASFSATAD